MKLNYIQYTKQITEITEIMTDIIGPEIRLKRHPPSNGLTEQRRTNLHLQTMYLKFWLEVNKHKMSTHLQMSQQIYWNKMTLKQFISKCLFNTEGGLPHLNPAPSSLPRSWKD